MSPSTPNFKFNLLFAIFVGTLVAVNMLGGKIITFFGFSISVGIFMIPIVFLITDIISESYGRTVSRQMTWTAFVVLMIVFAYTFFFVALPPASRYTTNAEYTTIFNSSIRMILASLTAFCLAQLNDIWFFGYIKKLTQDKYLWIRTNVSTAVSEFIDTFVFMTIAFYGISPKHDLWFILQLVIPYYLFKIAFATLNTPLVYAGVRWLKSDRQTEPKNAE